ncbi:MAG: hypothetical protein KKD73_04710 [Proteobacteria bacterium]|nr:hypothetical protein [Pseudomonadota bacterium]MBU1641451.1 hypothetical protein [Pseudomonadota bacterium]
MKKSSLPSKLGRIVMLMALFLAASVKPVWAIQVHTGVEGLYVHQGAHMFLAFSMLFFALNIRRSSLARLKAWRLLFFSAILFILWNMWAFVGHLSFFTRIEAFFIMEPGHITPSLPVNSWHEVIYYILKMDHLLCLPALLYFYFGLKVLFDESAHPQRQEEGPPS